MEILGGRQTPTLPITDQPRNHQLLDRVCVVCDCLVVLHGVPGQQVKVGGEGGRTAELVNVDKRVGRRNSLYRM